MTREISQPSRCIPVAQYLRMSTEHQKYSTANQSIAILQYAQEHNMEVVCTYADHGKSGLELATRSGLKQLLADAVEPDPGFQAVLVYDVSRWGRFQNPDQGASYEYMLEVANIRIHYCAEQFQNDGTLASAILKTLKRGMAGEFSRELSGKVWAANCRIASLGFHIGGYAGYGLRRQLIGENGKFKQILQQGDIKALQSEHVLLVPGPRDEIRIIHRIYKMYIDESLCEREIAEKLNKERIPWIGTRPWTRLCVRHILTNPKYIGVSVYNRTSFRLHKTFVHNPQSEWIWRAGAFKPIVSEDRFEQARLIFVASVHEISNQFLLDSLRTLIKRRGRASERLIDATQGMPSASTYIKRFGSLRNSYSLVGWNTVLQKKFIDTNRAVSDQRQRLIAGILVDFSALGVKVDQDKNKCLFTTSSGISISFVVTRCHPIQKCDYWCVYFPPRLAAHFYVVARLKPDAGAVMDYFIFPNGVIVNSRLTLGAVNAVKLDLRRFETLFDLRTALRYIDVVDAATVILSNGPGSSRGLVNGEVLPNFTNLQCTMKLLVADENFRTLLRADRFDDVPEAFCREVTTVREQMLAMVVCESYVTRMLGNERVKRYISKHHGSLLSRLELVA